MPIGLIAIPFVLGRIRESRGPAAALDLPGLALAAGAALGVMWGLVRGNSAGWGIAPFLIAPRAGALADPVGERPLIVAGTLLLGIGMGWLALVAGPSAPYLEMIAPMAIGGIGLSLALPAVTKSVVSLVAPQDIGKASGTYTTTRQLGGAFGVAILGAVFAATGGYASARAFSDGLAPAIGVSAVLALVGVVAGIAHPRRRPSAIPAAEAAPGAPPVATKAS